MKNIPVAGPSITQKEIDYVTEAVATAWYEGANRFNDRFERDFEVYCGRRHAVALPSCTSGLHLSLLALEIGPGDEVIVPDATWIASVAPVVYVGATPVFADMDRDSWCLSPEAFEALITPRTKATIVVNLYGSMPDWDAITAIAQKHGVALIEDAAESIGSRWRGRLAGGFGVFSAFSFHGSKTLTTGEGGMLLLDDDRLHDRVMRLRDHGRKPGDVQFLNEEVGWKYKMSSMQAALGIAQLERVAELVEAKRRIFGWYQYGLAGWSGGSLKADHPDLCNSHWMTTVILKGSDPMPKAELIAGLRKRGVEARPFFSPLSSIPAFKASEQAAAARARNVNAYAITPFGVNLPSALGLTEGDVETVCSALRQVVDGGT
ncbi:DegT/DnrJ/EryC1/StrS family aminotransferase [Methylocapsa palsarum]|uniref:Perosamine synthetase n=1 Tax=Methylocapsa palsarum TaxID=1612308 RepID=A0A1I3WPT7_9HYPH|nr:DegT/DnrJ/EryC1/StrS family aminotransferase [Methylocapsa palsarum]SFK09472.1 perosamine synthetase [Methylocapsa palsarum]